MKRIGAALLGAALLVSGASAQAQTYLGAGGYNCGALGKLAASHDPLVTSIQHWLLGYVSGLNMIWKAVRGTDRLVHSDGQEVASYVMQYCRANPQKTLSNAANDYFFSLPK